MLRYVFSPLIGKMRMPLLLSFVSGAILLAACSSPPSPWQQPPNVTSEAVVEKIVRESRSSKAFGEISSEYTVYLSDADTPDLRYVYVTGRAEEGDMSRTIGQRVLVKCYREKPGDYCYASSYSYQSRELVPSRKS